MFNLKKFVLVESWLTLQNYKVSNNLLLFFSIFAKLTLTPNIQYCGICVELTEFEVLCKVVRIYP
jgi:hypothetical protein